MPSEFAYKRATVFWFGVALFLAGLHQSKSDPTMGDVMAAAGIITALVAIIWPE